MEEFNIQLKLLKLCGFFMFPTNNMKKALNFLIFINIFSTFYCIFTSIAFVYDLDDILIIAETMSPTFTEIFTIIKYAIFLIYSEQFFDAIEKIGTLNQKCKFKNLKV